MYNYNLEIHDSEMSVYLYIVCVCLRWGSMCKRVHVRKSEKLLFWFVYIDLCGWQWNNYHTWQIPWFMFKLSASTWDMCVRWRFCFHTPYKVRKKSTSNRAKATSLFSTRVCNSVPCTHMTHQSHIWKKKKRKGKTVYSWLYIVFCWIYTYKSLNIWSEFNVNLILNVTQ